MAFTQNTDPIKDLKIGYEAQIKKWFENLMIKKNISYYSYSRDIALAYSAEQGNLEYVKFLLNLDANPFLGECFCLTHAILMNI